jgi:putative oxidoreductase
MLTDNRLPLALFLLRVGVFIVMFIWTIDKFVRPEHTAAVYEHFYFIGGLSAQASYVIGILEMVIILGFLLGYKKRFTYGAVFLLHAVSTLSSYKIYLSPFEDPNLLFYAAWPMLAACFALYYLRDLDTLWAFDRQ